jgi:hypothetical protein
MSESGPAISPAQPRKARSEGFARLPKAHKNRQFVSYKLLQTLAGNNGNLDFFTASRQLFLAGFRKRNWN